MDSNHWLRRAGRFRRYAPMLAVLCLGLLFSHHDLLLSGFKLTPGDPSDAYLVNYLLEHDFRWVTQQRSHELFWDTPMFYPHPNTTAFTETMLGGLPFYAPWRLMGIEPDTSFQLWFLGVGALNFLSCYFLLRKLLGADEIAANAGAFLLAYGSARIIQEWHPQLVPVFYIVLSFAGIWLFFSEESPSPRRAWTAVSLFVGGAVVQMYTGIYIAWFLVFSCFLAAVVATVHPAYRGRFFLRVHRDWVKLAVVAAAGVMVVWPLLTHSQAAASEVGLRTYDQVKGMEPGLPSYFKQSAASWLYGWLDPYLELVQSKGAWEESHGIGIFTSIIVLWSFWTDRRPAWRLLTIVCGLVFLFTIRLPNGFTLWKWVWLVFPGAAALRAVGRVGLFLLFPAAIALAAGLQRISLRFSPWVAALCALAMVAEQGVSSYAYDKANLRMMVENLANQVPRDCEAFLFSPPADQWTPVLSHMVGLWAQVTTGIPTVNAYSGVSPAHWGFDDPRITSEVDYKKLRQALFRWEREHPSLRQVCWLRPKPGNRSSPYALGGLPRLQLERVALSMEPSSIQGAP